MSPEQATALIVAITGLVAAMGAVFVQLRQTHQLLNGRLTQLVEQARISGHKEGELAGRDFMRRRSDSPDQGDAAPRGTP